MLALIVEVRIKPDKRDKFLEVIKYDALHSEQDEPGCLRFNVLQDNEDANRYYFFEVYKDEAALQAHREAPHFKHWSEITGEVLDGPVVRHLTSTIFPTDGGWH